MEEYEIKENNPESKENEDILQLGDTLIILGGTLAGTRGKVYFVNDDKIRIMPLGVSNRLTDIDVIDGDFDPSLDIGDGDINYVKGKTIPPSFVKIQNFRANQLIEAFKDGKLVNKYILKLVNEAEDSIILVDENEEQFKVDFNFEGIPLDLPFDVLRGREIPQEVKEEEVVEDIENLAEESGPNVLDDLEFFEEEVVVEKAGIEEIPSAQRNYPDTVQRSDMIQEFIRLLPTKSQKNDNKLKAIRRLVELCLLLRNELVKYGSDGEPLAVKSTIYESVLDIAKSDDVSISLPVADVKRTLYLDATPEEIEQTPSDALNIRILENEILQENKLLGSNVAGNVDSINQLPNWYNSYNKFFQTMFRQWSEKNRIYQTSFKRDKDFLRAPIPDMEIALHEGLPLLGKLKKDDLITNDNVSTVHYSILRGLKERLGRLKSKEPNIVLESADEAIVQSYLLFPKKNEREFGTTRSGKLAYDIGRSLNKIKLIESILKDGIQDIATTGSILAIGADGNTLGNIDVSDWLEYVPLSLYGLGDALVELASYGFNQKEFSFEQQKALVRKIESTIAHVKNHIKYVREKEAKETSESPSIIKKNLVSDERFESLITNLSSEAILLKLMTQVQRRTVIYKECDIAIFGHLYNKAQDLLLSKLANTNLLAYYRTKFVNQEFLERVQEGFRLKIKNDDKIFVPFENTCSHVKSLSTIYKVKDDGNRMKLLSKFLTKYQSYKKDNWIYCVECDKHLLCNHDFLLLQEYIHPREKDTLHKELLLTFSGGVFQGKYICKNCGQAISSLEFDTSLEYDDEGRPMMGRSVLVDEEEVQEEKLNELLGAPTDSVEAIKFDLPQKTLYYQTAKDIFDLIGVFPTGKAYIELVEGVHNEMGNQPERETYIKKNKANKSAMSYDTYINLVIIGIVASYCIIEIQTQIPSYTLKFNVQGCAADFRGYPMGSETDRRMLEYMACVISRIEKNNAPWKMTGLLQVKDMKKRQKAVENVIEKVIKSVIIKSDVMNKIIRKKTYVSEMYGKDKTSELEEVLIHGFRPVLQKSDEEVIVSSAANPVEKIRGIILQANNLAKESIKEEITPYSERSCCVNSIYQPLSFWKDKDIQKLGNKSDPRGPINTHSKFSFNLRKEGRIEKEITKDQYNAIFIQVCYKGENIGRSHEFGYNNKCRYCDLDITLLKSFDSNEIISEKKQQELTEEYNGVIESLLKNQAVEVDPETFEKLLNIIHLVNSVIPKPIEFVKLNKASKEVYNSLFKMSPEPFDGWKENINSLFEKLIKLEANPEKNQFVEAYGEISNKYTQFMSENEKMLGEKSNNVLKNLLEQPISQVIESIRISILVNLQRVIKGYNKAELEVTSKFAKDYELEGEIVNDINHFLKLHTSYIDNLNQKIKGFAKSKIIYGIDKLSALLNTIQSSIRGVSLPGGSFGVSYLIKSGVSGILYEMMNSNIGFPDTYVVEAFEEDTGSLVKEVISELIIRYDSESFKLTEDEIRLALAKRNEKEKILFINKFDTMTPEEKRSELLNKRLGLGDWARGGSKGIYAFDPEQYDFEREQRIQMGVFDPQDMAFQQKQLQEMAMDSGYENQQINEEDY
jgi:hypothetical protein